MDRRNFLQRVAGLLGMAVAAPLVAKVVALLPADAPEMEDEPLDAAIRDLIDSTLEDLGRPKFTEIATSLQKHTALRNLLKRGRIQFDTQPGQFNIRES